MFLKHLQRKTEHTIDGQASGTVITGSDGVTKGQVVFSRYEDVEASSSCLENGAFLSIGHAGYNSEVSAFKFHDCHYQNNLTRNNSDPCTFQNTM